MPKPHTLPTLYDDLKTISVSFLAKHGYLIPNKFQSGTLTWSRGGEKTGSISIQVMMNNESPYLVLDYKSNNEPIKYSVQLVSVASNIGKGVIWYFLCPHTHKRCRKLYLYGGRFYHRDAFIGCMYETQTYSQHSRFLCRQMDKLFAKENAYEKLYSKYFKKMYNGKQTKKYSKLLKQIANAQGISEAALLMS